MKIEYDPHKLTITPETRAEAVKLNTLRGSPRVDPATEPERYIEDVFGLKPVIVPPYRGSEWLEIEGQSDYIMPYLDWMRDKLGKSFEGKIDLLPALGMLCPTRILTVAEIDTPDYGESLHIAGYDEASYDHYARYGHDRAWTEKRTERYFERLINKQLGDEELCREFIPNRNGTYSYNPDYGRGKEMPVRKGCCNARVLVAVFQAWMEKYATEGQRALVAAAARLGKYGDLNEEYTLKSAYQGFHVQDDNGPTNWDGKGTKMRHVTWDEFKKA